MKKSKWFPAYENFRANALEGFGACLDEIKTDSRAMEWRIRKSDNVACVIEFFANGSFDVYEFKFSRQEDGRVIGR